MVTLDKQVNRKAREGRKLEVYQQGGNGLDDKTSAPEQKV